MILFSQDRSTLPSCSAVVSGTRSGRRCAAALASVLILVALGSLGCAFGEFRPHDPMQREYSLEEMQKRYTDLVRFGNFARAARFIAPEQRKVFLDSMPHEDDLRFLDYEIDPFVLNEEMTESTVD